MMYVRLETSYCAEQFAANAAILPGLANCASRALILTPTKEQETYSYSCSINRSNRDRRGRADSLQPGRADERNGRWMGGAACSIITYSFITRSIITRSSIGVPRNFGKNGLLPLAKTAIYWCGGLG